MANRYITIAGPIGVGKSTLATYLSRKLGYACFLESAADRNPFLEPFYKTSKRDYAFRSQCYFLVEALSQQQEIAKLRGGAIQDRSIWEHLNIFSRSMHEKDFLSLDEFETLSNLVEAGVAHLPDPDLLILMEGSTRLLQERIGQRGRSYERQIQADDLDDLVSRYSPWAQGWDRSPVLRLDAGAITLDDAGLDTVLEQVHQHVPDL